MSGSIVPRGSNAKIKEPQGPGPDWAYIKKTRHKGDLKEALADPAELADSQNKNDHIVGTKAAFYFAEGSGLIFAASSKSSTKSTNPTSKEKKDKVNSKAQ